MKRALAVVILAAIGPLLPLITGAQDYPSKPIRLVVPFSPGGGADIVARLIGQKLSVSFKQQILVDNIAGASGAIAQDAVARAVADGYTLILATGSTICTNPVVTKVPFDPIKDFTPVAMVALDPMALVVHPSVPAKTVQELVAVAKAKQGKLNMASFGTASISHLAGELFNSMAGIKTVHVPYKGGAPAMTDLMAGHVDLMFNSIGVVGSPARMGKIRLLAVAGTARVASLPEVPTVAESGLAGFEATTWQGVFGPANLPAKVVARLAGEIAEVLKLPDIRERIDQLGFEARSGRPEELAETHRRDLVRWTKVVKEAGIQLQ